MKKFGIIPAVAAIVILLLSLTGCQNTAGTGEEFTLSIGQTVNIADEDLKITFKEVSGDSRCPTGVVCVWAGEVTCVMRIEEGGFIYELDFVHSGATDDYSQMNFNNYRYTFKVEPYPVSGQDISDSKYKILLTVN